MVSKPLTFQEIVPAIQLGSFNSLPNIQKSDFLFEPDFDRQNGQNVTTVPNTPSISFNAVGGAQYFDYLSL